MKLSIQTNRAENILGFSYLVFYQLFLPTVISVVADAMGFYLTLSKLNIIFFVVNFVWVLAIFHRFIGKSWNAAWAKKWRCLGFAVLGLVLYFLAMFLMGFVIVLIDPNFSNVNDNAIAGLAQENGKWIFVCTVFFVPVVEELIYRGLIFQNLQRKNRLLAYCVTVAVFSFIHIMGFIGGESWRTLAICFVQYLPAGLALAWAYEKTDTIITPILIHIAINLLGMTILR